MTLFEKLKICLWAAVHSEHFDHIQLDFGIDEWGWINRGRYRVFYVEICCPSIYIPYFIWLDYAQRNLEEEWRVDHSPLRQY